MKYLFDENCSPSNKFLESQGYPTFTRELLIETASQLLDETKVDGAILALETAIKLDPHNRDNPRLDGQIVDILHDANRIEEARKNNHDLIMSQS